MLDWFKRLFHVEQTSRKEKLISAFLFFVYIFLVGFRGNIMGSEEQTFYESLIKPSATLPDWLFPFAWTALFVLIGFAGYHAWNFYKSNRLRRIFAGLYVVNGLLVYLWPYMFFTQQSVGNALYVIIGLIIVVELMILTAFKTNHKSAYLLLPYLFWILYLTYLNANFLILNV